MQHKPCLCVPQRPLRSKTSTQNATPRTSDLPAPPGKQPPEHPCLLFRDKQPAFLANAGLFVFCGRYQRSSSTMAVVLSPFLWANDPDHNADHQKNREQNFNPVDEDRHQHKHCQSSTSKTVPDRRSTVHRKTQPKCSQDDSNPQTSRRPRRILIPAPQPEHGCKSTGQRDNANTATAIN